MRFVGLVAVAALFVTPVLADGHGSHSGNKGGKKGDRFAMADGNGDGVISRDEFIALAGKRFDKMDADKNGSLSKDEMKRPRR